MENNFKNQSLAPPNAQDEGANNDSRSPSSHHLIPNVTQRQCQALRKLTLEQENLDNQYRKESQTIFKKYPNPFVDNNPFDLIVKDAQDIEALAASKRVACDLSNSETAITYSTKIIREHLEKLETRCHLTLTHLANIDWHLQELEEVEENYHAEMEAIRIRYNRESDVLSRRRSKILKGEHEEAPNDDGNEDENDDDYTSLSYDPSSSCVDFTSETFHETAVKKGEHVDEDEDDETSNTTGEPGVNRCSSAPVDKWCRASI